MQETSFERWARQEFGSLNVGDERRTSRTIALAAAAAERPDARITQVSATSAEQEAGYRWVRNSAITDTALMASMAVATVKRCSAHPYVFVAVDQATICIVDKTKKKGFGHVGRSGIFRYPRGLQVMSGLALSPTGATLGLVSQSWWARSDKRVPAYRQDDRTLAQRESSLWSDCLVQGQAAFDKATTPTQPWYQLDRGGDCYQVLTYADDHQQLMTIRSAYNRRLAGEDPRPLRRIFEGKEHQKRRSWMTLQLSKARAKQMQRAGRRTLRFALNYKPVTLRLKHPLTGDEREMSLCVVRVREHRPPTRQKRIEWWLLTTAPVASAADAEHVVRGYTYRWRVEEFHRAWKSGACNIESSQLRSRDNFQRWATLLAAVATRIERLKFLARNKPDTPAIQELSRDEIDAAIFRTKTKKHAPGDDLNIAQAVHLVAIVGGYTGNTKQGPPGTVTIGRGLEVVQVLAIGMEIGRKM